MITDNTDTENNTNYAYEQAEAQMQAIHGMVAALNCDYDRLDELTDQDAELTPEEKAELTELEAAAAGCADREAASERVQQDALSVEVRSGWTELGGDMAPEEFRIVLCTGGPHVEIRGELDQHCEPRRAWLSYFGASVPRATYYGPLADTEVLLTYCREFYFGEPV